jgi:sulfur-oxidizing protein SoxX
MIARHDSKRGRFGLAAQRAAVSIAALASAVTPSHSAVAVEVKEQGLSSYRVVADGIPEPLAATPGDAVRGKALIVARDAANCVLCHAVPDPAVRFAGDVGPSLAGIGARLSVSQLRLRVADNLRVNPASAMPSYYKVAGLSSVAAQYAGNPILTAAEVEDVVAYLATLR